MRYSYAMTEIGFIGLGLMGRPMAANLLRAGHALRVHNRSRGAVDELSRQGATAAGSPAEAAAGAEVVMTMLPDTPDVEAVVGELLDHAEPGTLLVDMSTISPVAAKAMAERAAERGLTMLDAPVSGGDVGAREGTLSIMVGGQREAVERARPLLEVLGSTVVHVGEPGSGQVVKACNQLVTGQVIEAVSEALVLGSKAGIDPEKLLDVLSAGLAANKVMEVRRQKFLEHDFSPSFRARLHAKDLAIVLETAREFGVAVPGTSLVAQMFSALLGQGRGDEDHSALVTVVEGLAGHRVGAAASRAGSS
jgi:2-hydroxy-3-oxopropionate reductase